MEQLLSEWLGEIVVGAVLGLLALSFRRWADTLERTTNSILAKLSDLQRDFNQHRVEVERRVTRVETKVDLVHSEALRGTNETAKH